MPLTPETVRAVARLLHETDLSEIEIETTGAYDAGVSEEMPRVRLQMRRGSSPVAPRRAMTSNAPAIAPVSESSGAPAIEADATTTIVTSPAVGVFRQSKTPVEVGTEVQKGQVLGIVEALKIPTDVKAPFAGKIAQILSEEGQGVEYDQALFHLETV